VRGLLVLRPAGLAALLVCGGACVSPDIADAATRAAAPLQVVASLHPATVRYGDPVTAEVEVDYDARTVAPSSIRAEPSFVPYVVTSAPVVQRPRSGVVRYRYSLLCVTAGCLPTNGSRRVRLEALSVTGLAGNRTVHAVAEWPVLRVSTRLAASDLTGRVRFRTPRTPPSPAYRLEPRALAGGLIAAAGLCTLVALALGWSVLARIRRRPAVDRRSPLEVAISYVRDSTRRTEPDRRRALELLAEAVDASGEAGLSAAAADTAWSKPPPTAAVAAELADEASRVLRGAG
jgi:hypothetical protein